MAKRWFHDENLDETATGLWPFHDVDREIHVPYLVDADNIDDWVAMSAATRTVYICNRLAEDRIAFQEQYQDRGSYKTVRYERLAEEPEAVATELSEFLDLSFGVKTEDVVAEIAPTEAPRDIENVLDACNPDVREQYLELRSQFQV